MKKYLSYLAILGIGAFAGNMINIGLSYGIHWSSLESKAFMEVFAIDFPLLLYPTAATLLPAFLFTLVLYFQYPRGSKAKRYWFYALMGLLIINLQTLFYHLPLNLDFVAQDLDLSTVKGHLSNWLILHWVRIVFAIVAGTFAIKAFVISLTIIKTDE